MNAPGRVQALTEDLGHRTYDSPADLHGRLITIAEAWLEDRAWAPALRFGATKGGGAPIIMDLLPDYHNSDELLGLIMESVRLRHLTIVSILAPQTEWRRPAGPQVPVELMLTTVAANRYFARHYWTMQADDAGRIRNWSRRARPLVSINPGWFTIFPAEAECVFDDHNDLHHTPALSR
ncbi:MAG: hypothetical protein PHE83_18630 [Opitutaceae bacterium]|nr:hypothetical protein [Opitutaceae bacterium]